MGEISDIVLGPQAVTNITFPVKLMTSGADGEYSNDNISNSTTVGSEEAFNNMVASSCNSTVGESTDPNNHRNKEILVMFDLMPTIKIYDCPIVTLAFTGQKTVMPCDKVIN